MAFEQLLQNSFLANDVMSQLQSQTAAADSINMIS